MEVSSARPRRIRAVSIGGCRLGDSGACLVRGGGQVAGPSRSRADWPGHVRNNAVMRAGVQPFSVAVDAAVIDDLRARIRRTRLPEAAPGEPWAQGTDRDWLEGLLGYWAEAFDWRAAERELNRFAHYRAIQSTKPQTLGYALTDSPAGLAAWMLEKWRSWSDCHGDLQSRFSADFLLTVVTLYWVTSTITSSMRDYYDNRRWQGEPRLGPGDLAQVPTAVAVFPHTLVPEGEPPREWAERLYDIRRWTVMPAGGHFAPAEEPELVARDIAAFFAAVDR